MVLLPCDDQHGCAVVLLLALSISALFNSSAKLSADLDFVLCATGSSQRSATM